MGLTQSQDVSATSTLTGPVVPQLAINIVVRHMVNSLLYIAGLFRCFYPAFGCCDRCRCVILGALLVGFRFSFAGAANMAQAKSACNGGNHQCGQPDYRFDTHSHLTPKLISPD